MILDTSFVLDVLRSDEAALEREKDIEHRHVAHALPAPVAYELWIGIQRSDEPGAEKDRVLSVIGHQPILPLDGETAKEAGRIQADLSEKGERIGHVDALIAGMARINDQTILTRNVDHFERIDNVHVETY